MTTPPKTPPAADPKQLERTGTVREIGSQAVWSLSSCKPGQPQTHWSNGTYTQSLDGFIFLFCDSLSGFGVDQLRDDNLETYWQSDGSQPHLVNIQFRCCDLGMHLMWGYVRLTSSPLFYFIVDGGPQWRCCVFMPTTNRMRVTHLARFPSEWATTSITCRRSGYKLCGSVIVSRVLKTTALLHLSRLASLVLYSS